MVTLKDIAKLAGVSPMTVSRVVNKQYEKVSDKTRRLIEGIIKEQGYVPNSSARSLSSKSTRLIAVIIQGEDNALEYPHTAAMTGYICHHVQDFGYTPILYYVNNYKEVSMRLRTWNVEGAIFLGMFDENLEKIQADNTIPLIFTDSYSKVRQVNNVGLDDFKGGVIAGEYLTAMGHKKIGFLGISSDRSSVVRHRLEGLRHALGQKNLTIEKKYIINDGDFGDPVKKLCLGPEPPTAFFVAADIEALKLIDCLRTMGLCVPKDLSVIGFDDLIYGTYAHPKLTTISQSIPQKAQVAVEMLFRHINNPSAPAENMILDVKLIERESVKRINS